MNISNQNGFVSGGRSQSRRMLRSTNGRSCGIPTPRILGLVALFAAAACGNAVNDAGMGESSTNTGSDDAAADAIGPTAADANTGEDATAPVQPDAAHAGDATGSGPTNSADAASPGTDAGGVHPDASTAPVDAGHGAADTGTPITMAPDAGTTPAVDAGSQPKPDAGTPPVPDAGTPVNTPDASGTGPGSTCVADLPAGWTLTTFNTATSSCPTGFDEHIVSGTPSVGSGACSCSCSVTQPGECGQGSLAIVTSPGHRDDMCDTAWFTATVNGSQCIPVPAGAIDLGNFMASPLPATSTGGACTSTAQTNTSAVTAPTQRYCDVPAASSDAVCNGTPPAGFSACIMAAGEVACPASTPFTQKFTVEDSATVSCGTCSACAVATTCSNPMVATFLTADCSGAVSASFAVNGTCVTNNVEATVLSIEYTSTTQATCAAGASTAAAQLTGARTICCR